MHSVHRGTRKPPSCSSEPCAHPKCTVSFACYTLIFLICFFFCTLAFMWFEVKSLFKVLVFWEEEFDFKQVVESISASQMDKSMFCCPPKQISIKGLDFLPQTSLSSSRQLSCVFYFLHKGQLLPADRERGTSSRFVEVPNILMLQGLLPKVYIQS